MTAKKDGEFDPRNPFRSEIGLLCEGCGHNVCFESEAEAARFAAPSDYSQFEVGPRRAARPYPGWRASGFSWFCAVCLVTPVEARRAA